ncbi:cobalamin-5'-phosphate synthase [Hoeflea marina]|uniref:Adenosylcobinamide-GDP ribazoletransferase n=2 Tax=Hoeflea marina TaxID=274592 RepID=A0A317PTR0_9HYPH|nr:cobalamin-5'-phosphate synthase [Hoeflea marina]
MNHSDLLDDIARSAGFLSRLPMPSRHFAGHDGQLSRAVRMFPVAGLLIALPAALLTALLAGLGANPALTALLALGVLIGVTGALHEDGLADSADAFGAGGDRTRMLAIMKDSRIGSYGALALILSLALRAVSMTILIAVLPWWLSALVILAVAAASRAAMVWHWDDLRPARENGVAVSVGEPEGDAARLAVGIGAAVLVLTGALAHTLVASLLTLGVAAAVTYGWSRLAEARIGGHSGDTIGATQQLTEIAALATLALLL